MSFAVRATNGTAPQLDFTLINSRFPVVRHCRLYMHASPTLVRHRTRVTVSLAESSPRIAACDCWDVRSAWWSTCGVCAAADRDVISHHHLRSPGVSGADTCGREDVHSVRARPCAGGAVLLADGQPGAAAEPGPVPHRGHPRPDPAAQHCGARLAQLHRVPSGVVCLTASRRDCTVLSTLRTEELLTPIVKSLAALKPVVSPLVGGITWSRR